MSKREDIERLNRLYVSQPETRSQSEERDRLIKMLETKLGMRTPDSSPIVEHGETKSEELD